MPESSEVSAVFFRKIPDISIYVDCWEELVLGLYWEPKLYLWKYLP
jgi:hypothetical protein